LLAEDHPIQIASVWRSPAAHNFSPVSFTDIIEPRLQELLPCSAMICSAPGSTGRFPPGFVLAAAGQANWPDRSCGAVLPFAHGIAEPKGLADMPEAGGPAEYATVVGLVLYGAKAGGRRRSVPGNFGAKLKSSLPGVVTHPSGAQPIVGER